MTAEIASRESPSKEIPRDLTGKAIRRLRDSLSLTQHQLAARIGVHPITVAQWEGERHVPTGSARVLLAIARASPALFLKITSRFAC